MVSLVMQAEFLSKVPIPQENLITIDDWDVCSAAAHGYENRLKYVTQPTSYSACLYFKFATQRLLNLKLTLKLCLNYRELTKAHKVLHTTNVNHHKYPRFDLVRLSISSLHYLVVLGTNVLI